MLVVSVSGHLDTRATAAPESAAEIFHATIAAAESPSPDAKLTANGSSCASKNNQAIDEKRNTSKLQTHQVEKEVQNEKKGDCTKRLGSGVDLVGTGAPG